MNPEPGLAVVTITGLDRLMLQALPELETDLPSYRERAGDPGFSQSFFGYSFVPTLQAALDRGIDEFCRRAFLFVEELVTHGDRDVLAFLQDEFFAYGPHCEGWMSRARCHMGPKTLTIAEQNASRR